MTTTTDHETAVATRFAGLSPEQDGRDPSWLADARRSASAWVESHGFPTSKDEDWRYTGLGPILEVPLEPAGGRADDALAAEVIDALSMNLGGARLAFVNGHFAPRLSRLVGLPEQARISNLASVLAEEEPRLRPLFARYFREHGDAFAALNAALVIDGAFIDLPAGTTVDEPIELVFFTDTGGHPLLSSPRSVILVGSDSRATIVEIHAGTSGDLYCTNAVTQIVLDEGAEIEHYNIQDEAESAFHLASLEVRQGRESRFSSHLIALGSRIARHEVRILLCGEGSEVDLDGLYLPRGDQHHDHPVLVEHAAPHCRSHQLYKGIVDGHGHGVFNGHVVVQSGAIGTDASQTNKNLLLSDQAEVDTRPRLEIFADDVACSHGAAVGRLDKDALFYLRSRGIAEPLARGLLVQGFAREMVDRLESEPLRSRVEKLIAGRLATTEHDYPLASGSTAGDARPSGNPG